MPPPPPPPSPPAPPAPRHGRDHDDHETVRQVPLAGDQAATTARARPTLSWRDSQGAHSLTIESRVLVGASPRAGVVVADPTVSRLHAELDPRLDGLWVTDLGSKNGTMIDGVLVTSGRVPDGGRVQLGATVIAVEYSAETTPVPLWETDRFGPLVGGSTAMRELFAQLALVAPSHSSVLIQGETGTGKELVAWALHEASPRASGPFVVVDCAALPESLLEAELFGHTKGAFTGAVAARAGAIESADGGTVFLDEIGELPLAMQPKLLRALESRAVRRLGEAQHRKVDVRFVCATHRDLAAMINAGTFREDLYFRVAVLPVVVPPLRARADDIPRLIAHFLVEARAPGGAVALGPAQLADLAARSWPGNVRELRNFVERAATLGAAAALAMADGARGGASAAAAGGAAGASGALPALPTAAIDRPFRAVRDEWMDHLEREYIRAMLARHGGNVSAAAQAAGLGRTYVHKLIRKYDL